MSPSGGGSLVANDPRHKRFNFLGLVETPLTKKSKSKDPLPNSSQGRGQGVGGEMAFVRRVPPHGTWGRHTRWGRSPTRGRTCRSEHNASRVELLGSRPGGGSKGNHHLISLLLLFRKKKVWGGPLKKTHGCSKYWI